MPTILDKIVAHKRKEVKSLPSIDPVVSKRRSLIDSVLSRQPGLITEIKPKSPSAGELIRDEDVPHVVEIYDRNSDGISVLCDNKYFGGDFDLLKRVSGMTEVPLLAKEFIICESQIDHAANNGASAVLLIVAILSPELLQRLAHHAIELNLDVLVETHNQEEANQASEVLVTFPPDMMQRIMVGVNNRNLKEMKTDLSTTEEVAPFLQQHISNLRCLISESGVKTPDDVIRLSRHVQGFLIGESLLKANDPEALIQALRGQE